MARRVKLLYSAQAERDLEDIFDYISADSHESAVEFVERMDREISRLAEFPLLGVIPKDTRLQSKGYRVLVARDYLVFYVFKRNAVRIRRVIHAARHYASLL